MLNKSIETPIKIVKNVKFNGILFDKYIFSTNSSHKYEVDFVKKILRLKDQPELSNYFNDKRIVCIDINFTIFDNNKRYSTHEYTQKTKLNEQYEVIGKLIYCIQTFVQKNKNILLYSVGKDFTNNLDLYKQIQQNNFPNFDVVEDFSEEYKKGAIYFIKK